ncbi:MAG: hypothetical protein QXH67_06760 [Candidatus Bathyarchaeia archaeon]
MPRGTASCIEPRRIGGGEAEGGYPRNITEKLQFVEVVLDGLLKHLERGGTG